MIKFYASIFDIAYQVLPEFKSKTVVLVTDKLKSKYTIILNSANTYLYKVDTVTPRLV